MQSTPHDTREHTVAPITSAIARFGAAVPALSTILPRERIADQLRRVRAFRGGAQQMLLPIERHAAVRVLDRKINALESGIAGYQRIPLAALRDVLSWRNDAGWPVLAPFSVQNPEFALMLGDGGSEWEQPMLPQPITACYHDVFEKLRALRGRRRVEMRCSARFDGMIPPDVRRIIVHAQSAFSDIRILAEVERWKIEETEFPALASDPLVIGYDGVEFWLIAAFDITPLEDAVRKICTGEFAGA